MIQFKRTMMAYKGYDFPIPEGTNTRTGVLTLESGERISYVKVQDRRGISAYACALELTGCSFYYIPEPAEVLYAISRIRNPRYHGGHVPTGDAICDVYRSDAGSVFVRIGFSRINVYSSAHLSMSDSERAEWREYLVQWIDDHLLLQE